MKLNHPPFYEFTRNGNKIRVEACSNCDDENRFPVPRDVRSVGLMLICPKCGKHIFGDYNASYWELVDRWNDLNS